MQTKAAHSMVKEKKNLKMAAKALSGRKKKTVLQLSQEKEKYLRRRSSAGAAQSFQSYLAPEGRHDQLFKVS